MTPFMFAYECTDAPDRRLVIGYRESDDKYPRVFIRSFNPEVVAVSGKTGLTGNGRTYADIDLGFLKSQDAMMALTDFMDAMTSQINRVGDYQSQGAGNDASKAGSQPEPGSGADVRGEPDASGSPEGREGDEQGGGS